MQNWFEVILSRSLWGDSRMHRIVGQGCLGEGCLSPKLGRNLRLEQIAAAFDWAAVERLVAPIHAAPTEGRAGRR